MVIQIDEMDWGRHRMLLHLSVCTYCSFLIEIMFERMGFLLPNELPGRTLASFSIIHVKRN